MDASQGIEAQTVANFWLAFSEGLVIVPILNKIDLPGADVEGTLEQLESAFELDPTKMVPISAKTGLNVESILPRLIEWLPPPRKLEHQKVSVGALGHKEGPLRALLFDTYYDTYRGVICYFSIIDGQLSKGKYFLVLGPSRLIK